MIKVIVKAINICNIFMIIDSFDTRPIKIPKTIMHRSIIIKDSMKVMKFAFLTKKNGINGKDHSR